MILTQNSWQSIGQKVVVRVLLCACLCSCESFRSENSEAIRFIQEGYPFSGEPYMVLPIGEVQLMRRDKWLKLAESGKWDRRKGQTPAWNLAAYEVLEQQGAIVISSNTDLTDNKDFSWGNWSQLTQEGVVRKLTVSLVPTEYEQLRCPDVILNRLGAQNLICIETGSCAIQEIIRSQKFQIGAIKYWLIMGTYDQTYSEIERLILDRQGEEAEEEHKFIAIAQYEEFANKWKIIMKDLAPRAGQFPRQKEFDNILRQATITDKQQ